MVKSYNHQTNPEINNNQIESLDFKRIIQKIEPTSINSEIEWFDSFKYKLNEMKTLDLSSCNLKSFPSTISKELKNLEILDLSYNTLLKLNENASLRHLSANLKELSMTDCILGDEDFEILGQLSALEKLNISDCKLDIKEPRYFIKVLEKLKYLNISYSTLSTEHMKLIFSHSALETLIVNSTDLSEVFNDSLVISEELITNLKILHISRCNLEGLNLKTIFNFINLEELKAESNNLSEIDSELVEELFNNMVVTENIYESCCEEDISYDIVFTKIKVDDPFMKLKILDLGFCNIESEQFIRKIFDLNSLESLNICQSRLNFDLKDIAKGRSNSTLKKLNVKACRISESKNLKEITDFEKLEELFVYDNSLNNLEADFCLGQSRFSLKMINACNSNIDSNGFRIMTDCPKLEKLVLHYNNIGDLNTAFKLGCSKYSLKELILANTNINLNGLKAITECSQLEVLCISSNTSLSEINEDFDFGNLKKTLKELKISSCNLDSNAFKSLISFSKLENLNFSFNDLSNINDNFDLGQLKETLKIASFDTCKLNKNMLIALSNCKCLESLYLCSNPFSEIDFDFSFKELENTLKKLHIRFCNLNFKHLSELGRLKNLELLAVNGNNLSEVPSDLKFENSFNSLNTLHLDNCKLDHKGLKVFSFCKNIKELNIKYNNFKDMPRDFSFENMKDSLEFLQIGKSHVTHSGLKAITECKNLKRLIIYENDFSEIDSDFSFGTLVNSLESLNFYNSKLNPKYLEHFKGFEKLEYLNVFNNEIPEYEFKEILDILKREISILQINYSK